MSFQSILQDVVDNVKGGFAGSIMATDGISVHDYIRESGGCDLEVLGAEYGKVVVEIRKASQVLGLGEVEEVAISACGMKVLLRILNEELFLALVLSPEGSSGKGKFLLRKAVRLAKQELGL